MSKHILVLVCLVSVWLSTVAKAQSESLYFLNLVKQQGDSEEVPESKEDAVKSIRHLESQIRRNPNQEWHLLYEIANIKACQGRLTEAMNDLSLLIVNSHGESLENVLAERAEVKSLLGFTAAALEDCDKAWLGGSKWLHLWHRWLILKRAGDYAESKRALQKAVRACQRYNLPSAFSLPLLHTAQLEHVVVPPDDSAIADKVMSLIKKVAGRSNPLSLEEIKNEFGIELQNNRDHSGDADKSYIASSIDSLWTQASATESLQILHLSLNTDVCLVSRARVKELFDAGTMDELFPGRSGGSSQDPLMLFTRENTSQALVSFRFDSTKEPVLSLVTFVWKDTRH